MLRKFKIRLTAANGTQRSVTVVVTPTMTKTQVRDAFAKAINEDKFIAEPIAGSNKLTIKGYAKPGNQSQLTKVEAFNFNFTGNFPKLVERTEAPDNSEPEYVQVP